MWDRWLLLSVPERLPQADSLKALGFVMGYGGSFSPANRELAFVVDDYRLDGNRPMSMKALKAHQKKARDSKKETPHTALLQTPLPTNSNVTRTRETGALLTDYDRIFRPARLRSCTKWFTVVTQNCTARQQRLFWYLLHSCVFFSTSINQTKIQI